MKDDVDTFARAELIDRIEQLQRENEELREALSKAYGRWSLGCDPNAEFPDWPDDAVGVMNDLWKDGWPTQARAALREQGRSGRVEDLTEEEVEAIRNAKPRD